MAAYLLKQPKTAPMPPSRTYALVVGIEEYDFASDDQLPLPGCRVACERFRKYLLGKDIDDKNIFVHISPKQESIEGAEFRAVGKSISRIARDGADLVFVYWAGHGYANDDRRSVLLADSYATGFGYDVDALIARLVKNNNVHKVIAIFDCCADPVEALYSLPSAITPSQASNADLYVLFACSLGQRADYYLDPKEGEGGKFSDELFAVLEEIQTWPLMPNELDEALQRKFKELKQNGQRPIRYHCLTPTGKFVGKYSPDAGHHSKWHPIWAWLLGLVSRYHYGRRYRRHIFENRPFDSGDGRFAIGDLPILYI